MNDTKNWFVHVEWVVILVIVLGGFYLLDGKIESKGARTFRLYEMFIDLIKDIFELRADFNQKFYDILAKERK